MLRKLFTATALIALVSSGYAFAQGVDATLHIKKDQKSKTSTQQIVRDFNTYMPGGGGA